MNQKLTLKRALVIGLAWAAILFLLLPLAVSVPVSFTPNDYLSMPQGHLSLDHYRVLFTDDDWPTSFLQSGLIALVSATISVFLGTLCAIGLWKIASSRGEAVRLIVLFPLIVPPIVSALAFYRLWADWGLLDSYPGTILAHVVLSVPYVVVAVSASLATLGVKIEQASRNLGANLYQTLRYVILPAIRPGVLSASVFAFILSWDELVVTLFISSRHIYTLPRRMWDGMRENVDPAIAAVSTLLLLATCVVIALSLIRKQAAGDL
ncbi:ABC transporter permease subunit [Paraburkholderia sp. 1N]|uniref:ABC transporter permease subunit n=1 Tax=Paraburkholderia solitsugae TaxID=2675748 RepID=A0ABX2BH82_9BURK|nr:ABC transporter permease [Paraburkholderia solitsugae]NPT40282.1 ABC transporter permease subunit [Paraburkholderia solitsugae]